MPAAQYLLGNEFFVYDSSANPIAYATECTLSVSADTISTSNKQSGVWASALPGQISWSINTSALYTSEAKYNDLFAKMVGREAINFKFGQITSLGDASTDIDTSLNKSKGYYEGVGYITSLELSAGNNEVASYSISINGNGSLLYKTN